ncbi:MAG: twin-arginine translocase TatA/TatE family subunit [Deltaproteobacteria bacterium]|nr:MAG: twin-arginine translocase TatA/TatE family subunit [Deltaproteobacteria bacterium]
MLGIGLSELIIIFLIIFFLFGGKRLPEIATGLGTAIKNFKAALKSENRNSDND